MPPLVAQVEDVLRTPFPLRVRGARDASTPYSGVVAVLPPSEHVLRAARQPEHVEVTEIPPREPGVDRHRELEQRVTGRDQGDPTGCGWISSADPLNGSTRMMSQLRSATSEDRLQREEHVTVPSVCLVVDLSPFGFRFVLLWSECDDRFDGTGDRGVDA